MLKHIKKYEPIAWPVIGVVHDKYFVLRRQSMTRLYDFVGIAFFKHWYFERHDCLLGCLNIVIFMSNYRLFL